MGTPCKADTEALNQFKPVGDVTVISSDQCVIVFSHYAVGLREIPSGH